MGRRDAFGTRQDNHEEDREATQRTEPRDEIEARPGTPFEREDAATGRPLERRSLGPGGGVLLGLDGPRRAVVERDVKDRELGVPLLLAILGGRVRQRSPVTGRIGISGDIWFGASIGAAMGPGSGYGGGAATGIG